MQWEYLEEFFYDHEETRDIEKFLNTLGEDGWELCCHNPTHTSGMFLFKRPLDNK